MSKGKERRFISLNLKMTSAIMAGIVLALGVVLVCTLAENALANKLYLSDSAKEKTAGKAYKSLEDYIDKNHIKATDSSALSEWLKTQEYTYLFIYDNYGNVFEAGWWVDSSGETTDVLEDEDTTIYSNTEIGEGGRITEEKFVTDACNRIITFADGDYYVYLRYYGEDRLYNIMNVIKVVLSFITLLVTLLLYNGALLKRVILLSRKVKDVSEGDLKTVIQASHNDEIGRLANGVNDMRNSIIEKHESEKEAWDANTQLITSMSHDIRTPLTSLIGYLDIIEGKKYKDEEEFNKYISSCRDKAFQLKDLSDKLFQYFLVFGSPETERTLEVIDGGILFQQLLVEHVAEAVSYGYNVNLNYNIPDIYVNTDVSGLRRLFDNLFSNIMKYAAKGRPVEIEAYCEEGLIHIQFRNRVAEHAKKVESTRIGVKTCERICNDLHGSFEAIEDEKYYKSHMAFPIYEMEDAEHGIEE